MSQISYLSTWVVGFMVRRPPTRKAAQAVTLLDQLRERRASARTAAEAVLTRAAETGEPMTAEDLAEHGRAVADEREAADSIEAWHSDQLAEIRASIARTPGAA